MVMVDRDGERERSRRFYLCRSCGEQVTFLEGRNLMDRSWPKGVFESAVQSGFINRSGRVLI
jgi:hypothetical protein